tara:strand:- start:8778 stop:10085 length:1308 start_codon:yes stop_codon:yes gene_type:complete
MKKVNSIILNKNKLKSTANLLGYKITGEVGAVFSLQVKDSSSPNKFYNFKTKAFTNTFTSENTLSNVVLDNTAYSGQIKIPAASSGASYRFLVFAEPIFNTEIQSNNTFFLRKDITQEAGVTVRFSTASDQAVTASYVGLGTNVGSTSGSANQTAGNVVTITDYEIKDSEGAFLGYKFEFDVERFTQKVADSLQPIDSDFFTSQSKTTNGSGSSATAMVLTNIDNLVVGMSLISITSSTVTTSGSLGVLTFPTITAIDTDNKTVTLSSAHSWADNKAVVFRAYGSDLITQSTGGVFEFNNFKVEPASRLAAGVASGSIAKGKLKPLGHFVINGTMGSPGTTLTVDDSNGVSSGARIFGPRVDTSGDNNLISSVNVAGTSVVVGGNQQLSDNTVISVLGAAPFAFISGNITIATFPSISTDIFYDIDRAIVLSTLS